MFRWAATFLVLALAAAVFGFGFVETALAAPAKTLFFAFLVLFLISVALTVGRQVPNRGGPSGPSRRALMPQLKSQPKSPPNPSAKAQTKPVVDAVIDCVAALSGLARSVRARARHPVKQTRAGFRKARRGAVRTGRRIAREVKDAVKGKGEKFEKSLGNLGRRGHAAARAVHAAVHSPSRNGVRPRAS